MGYIYQITNLINNKKYIGSSKKDPKENWGYYGSGKLIKNSIKKYGKKNFKKEILAESKHDIKKLEKKFLEEVDAKNSPDYYNMTNDAVGSNFHSKEGKKSRSEKLKGRKLSKETREKISKNKLGTKQNRTKTRKDKGISRPSIQGRISPNKGKGKQVNLFTVSGEYISTYDSYYDLAINLEIHHETVRCHLIGKIKTLKNKQYYAEYKN